MLSHPPWLSQGDVFRDVQVVTPARTSSGSLEIQVRHGPALLVTHDCVLDKRNRRDEPTAPLFHFLPLIAVDAQDRNKQAAIRRNELTPREVLYLGDCGELGESFVLLHEVYALPARLFNPYLDAFADHPDAQPGELHLAIRDGDSRIGCLAAAGIDMLRTKWSIFWTRLQPQLGGDPEATVSDAVPQPE